MLIFPPACATLPPSFSFVSTADSRLAGYTPRSVRSRIRLPVYAQGLASPPEVAVMGVHPRITSWNMPGLIVLLPEPHVERVHLLSSVHAHDEGYSPILSAALDWASRYQLLVWDAEEWREGLLAFDRPEVASLRDLPVLCLRTALEAQGIDVGTLPDACARFGFPAPGHDLLGQAYCAEMCWQALRAGVMGDE